MLAAVGRGAHPRGGGGGPCDCWGDPPGVRAWLVLSTQPLHGCELQAKTLLLRLPASKAEVGPGRPWGPADSGFLTQCWRCCIGDTRCVVPLLCSRPRVLGPLAQPACTCKPVSCRGLQAAFPWRFMWDRRRTLRCPWLRRGLLSLSWWDGGLSRPPAPGPGSAPGLSLSSSRGSHPWTFGTRRPGSSWVPTSYPQPHPALQTFLPGPSWRPGLSPLQRGELSPEASGFPRVTVRQDDTGVHGPWAHACAHT